MLRFGPFALAVAGSLPLAVHAAADDGSTPRMDARNLPDPETLLGPEVDPGFFPWTLPLTPPEPRETDRPCRCGKFLPPVEIPRLLPPWRGLLADFPAADTGDLILKGPEALIDEVLSLALDLFPRSGRYDWTEEDRRSITSRFLEWQVVPRRNPVFTDFMETLVEREQRFFLRFEDSYLFTPSYELRLEEVDYDDLRYEQQKVILDVLRKTYLVKYRFRPEERLRDDAFGFRGWGGADFAILPPVMAGYLYLRGLERKFTLGGTELGVHLEPLSRWTRGEEDLHAGAGLEWRIRGFPVALMVTAGMIDGDVELDFVGLGTSLGIVRKALHLMDGKD